MSTVHITDRQRKVAVFGLAVVSTAMPGMDAGKLQQLLAAFLVACLMPRVSMQRNS